MNKYYVGACSDLGVHIDGAALGPRALFKDRDVNIKYFDMPTVKKSLDPQDLKKNFKQLYYSEIIFSDKLELKD